MGSRVEVQSGAIAAQLTNTRTMPAPSERKVRSVATGSLSMWMSSSMIAICCGEAAAGAGAPSRWSAAQARPARIEISARLGIRMP